MWFLFLLQGIKKKKPEQHIFTPALKSAINSIKFNDAKTDVNKN